MLGQYGFKLNSEVVHNALKLIVNIKLERVNASSSRFREFSDHTDLKILYVLCFIEPIHPIMDHKSDPT